METLSVICGIAFKGKRELTKQTNNVHDVKEYSCDICGKILIGRKKLINHKDMHCLNKSGLVPGGKFNGNYIKDIIEETMLNELEGGLPEDAEHFINYLRSIRELHRICLEKVLDHVVDKFVRTLASKGSISLGCSFPFSTNLWMMSSLPSLRLIYFPVRARAECARMILAYGGISYTDDDCTSFFGCDFIEAKESEKLPFGQLPVLFIQAKESGALPFGQLPVLEVAGGRLIAQSGAIDRYLASLVADNVRPGFVPEDPTERAHCDMVHEVAQDLAKVNPIVNWFRGDEFQTEKDKFLTKVLPPRLLTLSKILGNQKFFCGDAVTYCDFAVYHQLDLSRLLEPNALKEYPNVAGWMTRVEALDGVREYLEGRPEPVDIGVNPRLQKKQ